YLDRFEEFRAFRRSFRRSTQDGAGDIDPSPVSPDETPEELLEHGYQQTRAELSSDLLARVKSGSPRFFERLVVELLLRMGYGGNRADAGRAVGGVGDEGIDGIISQDRLGLEAIYVQAKRWEGSVGR